MFFFILTTSGTHFINILDVIYIFDVFNRIIIKEEIIEIKHEPFDITDEPLSYMDQNKSININEDCKLWPLSK